MGPAHIAIVSEPVSSNPFLSCLLLAQQQKGFKIPTSKTPTIILPSKKCGDFFPSNTFSSLSVCCHSNTIQPLISSCPFQWFQSILGIRTIPVVTQYCSSRSPFNGFKAFWELELSQIHIGFEGQPSAAAKVIVMRIIPFSSPLFHFYCVLRKIRFLFLAFSKKNVPCAYFKFLFYDVTFM